LRANYCNILIVVIVNNNSVITIQVKQTIILITHVGLLQHACRYLITLL
jgi:hypothetical protein